MMWAAGTVAAMSSITFPAVSALVSHSASPDQQGELTCLRTTASRNISVFWGILGVMGIESESSLGAKFQFFH